MASIAYTIGSYPGLERRRNVVFYTQNSEYHCSGDECVAVRNPRTGQCLYDHPAIGRRLCGAIRLAENGEVSKFVLPGERPEVGDHLFFSEGRIGTELRTSPVREIARPSKDAVGQYLH